MQWFITCGHPAVRQRFFVALDALERACLVDDQDRALAFPLREDAERYAALHCADDDWSVTRA